MDRFDEIHDHDEWIFSEDKTINIDGVFGIGYLNADFFLHGQGECRRVLL